MERRKREEREKKGGKEGMRWKERKEGGGREVGRVGKETLLQLHLCLAVRTQPG